MGLMEKYHIAGDAESLEAAAVSHRAMAALVGDAAREVAATPLESWTGAAAEAAALRRRNLADAMTQTARAMTTIADGHDDLATEIRSTRSKIEGLVAGAVAATAVGIILTWATAGLLASTTLAVDAAIAGTIGTTILGLESATVAAIASWVVFNSVIGIIEGITFTGVDHEVDGSPWTPDDAAQVFTIAAGNLVGRGASAGVGRVATTVFGEAESTAARTAQGALAGAVGGATGGTVNPILVPLARGDAVDWTVVGASAGVNAGLGAIGGGLVEGLQIKPGAEGRFTSLSRSINTIRGRGLPPVGAAAELTPLRGVPGGDGLISAGSTSGESSISYQGDPDAESLYFSADSDGEGTFYSANSDGSFSDDEFLSVAGSDGDDPDGSATSVPAVETA